MRRLAILFSFISSFAWADDAGYEERLVAWGLELHQREKEPAPEGKAIEEILFATENVFAPGDPFPLWLNSLHVRTREHVIARELLVSPGQPWQADWVEESERNLRRLYILAIVRLVPVKGKNGGVALLVVTKDRWSLRLNSDFNWVGPLLQYLRLQPTENNLFGYNQQLSADIQLRLDTLTLGQVYQAQRFSRFGLLAGQSASVVINRQTGQAEGFLSGVVFGKPLRNLDDTQGYYVSVDGRSRIRRIYKGASVWQLPFPEESAQMGSVPYVFSERLLNWEGAYTRSFGRAFKLDVTVGMGGYLRKYGAARESGLSSEESEWLVQNYLPRSENASYLQASVRAFRADFRVLRDVDTFELSEDFQLGPSAYIVARWAHPWLGLTQQFFEIGTSLRYRWSFSENLLTLSFAGAAREFGARGWVNQKLAAEVLYQSAKVLGGRFVVRGMMELRRRDLDNRQQLLGGGNGLRGAAAESLTGPNLILLNAEYRSRPVEIQTVYLGGVLFYDAGSAFASSPSVTHTVGVGLRILVPQWNQETIRIDFGMVLNDVSPVNIDRFSGSYGQVTDYRSTLFGSPLN